MVAANGTPRLLDHLGRPLLSPRESAIQDLLAARAEVVRTLRARYDAAQTVTGNEAHWANADRLSPDAANTLRVRRKLRSRSRYECIENNPYLKGILLSITNDFTGAGPRLKIIEKGIRKETRRKIEKAFQRWASQVKLRKKLWRLKLAKMVDGESFLVAYTNKSSPFPVRLDFQVIEADRISSEEAGLISGRDQVDGVRHDTHENPTEYFLLNYHPGSMSLWSLPNPEDGKWIRARYMVHWFRQDRGWLRGIPETTPSLPLCALLRRYTLAVVRAAETSAEFAAVLESEGPPNTNVWTDGAGNLLSDDPFDVFPVELGMITSLPWGYKLKQLEAKHPGLMYDIFVNALLREIARPLLAPFNRAAGTSKDSNMATAVVDDHIYVSGIGNERLDCNESVLDPIVSLWWEFVSLNPSALGPGVSIDRLTVPPEHTWRWDRVGLDHTDPKKVADSLIALRRDGILTDRDIQESRFNRDVDDWRDEITEDREFRRSIDQSPGDGGDQDQDGAEDQDGDEDQDGEE